MESKIIVKQLAALAQDTRLAIFRLLVVQGPQGMAVGKIAEQLQVAPATLSFHLKELCNSGLIQARQESRFIYYSADFAAMTALLGFLSENCCNGNRCDASAAAAQPCDSLSTPNEFD